MTNARANEQKEEFDRLRDMMAVSGRNETAESAAALDICAAILLVAAKLDNLCEAASDIQLELAQIEETAREK